MKLQLGGNNPNNLAASKQQLFQQADDGLQPPPIDDTNSMANVAVMGVQRGPIKANR